MENFSGKTVLITGSGAGIGRGIAESFVAAGASVAINDINSDAVDEVVWALGAGCLAVAGDISQPASAAAIVGAVEAWRPLDILINCAGVAGEIAPLTRQSSDDWQRVIDVNLKGTYLMCQAGAQHMAPRNYGAIVNIASIVGMTGFPASNAYGVSKAAVVMLTKTLAAELARYSIRVNAVSPGVIEAPMLDQMTGGPAGNERVVSRVPLGRLGLVSEVSNAVLFLASEAASYITGATLPVDGGWLAFGGAGDASRASPTHRLDASA